MNIHHNSRTVNHRSYILNLICKQRLACLLSGVKIWTGNNITEWRFNEICLPLHACKSLLNTDIPFFFFVSYQNNSFFWPKLRIYLKSQHNLTINSVTFEVCYLTKSILSICSREQHFTANERGKKKKHFRYNTAFSKTK